MRVALISNKGQLILHRDIYAELARRMKERGLSDEAIATFKAAADEFQSEFVTYARTVPEV